MHIPTSSEREDLERVAALWDRADGGRVNVDPFDALADAGVIFEDATRWLLDAQTRGLLELDSGIVPEARLTGEGRQLVEQARQRVADRSGRRRLAMARLLAWTDAAGGNVATFEATDYAWVDGARLTFAECVEVAQLLHDAGLVTARTTTAWGAGVVRADVEILPAGRLCLDEFDGDVRAYQTAAASLPGLNSQHVTISNVTGPVVVGGHGSTNIATWSFDPEQVRALAQALLGARDALGLDTEQAATLDDQLIVLNEASDPGRVQRALRWVADLARVSVEKGLAALIAAEGARILGG
jgi:hypothetical protein